ncbi:hypothetical protein, variant [Aphanomyces invadans]|uniref:Uncharacterized protein n=1 Tax=Aphanomyces invadans TaxID=157072 RepID=A0A024U1I9_9STRA|nr:hypothetical protein, variant [Aphanomyces invadans]ETV99761.1 hypothetical protein, variant [Aphanomyces invadans]|eukprot:XP_008871537.1 hypothetical protein, variant [Aphanomyces invadans]
MATEATEGEVLGRYEQRLAEKYRFALHVIIDHMACFVSLFHHTQIELKSLEALAQKKMPQMLPFLSVVHDKINYVTQATPLFLGYDHLVTYIKVLQQEKHNFDPRPQPWNALRLYDNEYQDQFASKVQVFTTLYQELDARLPEFLVEVERHAPLLQLLSQKREDMFALLRKVHAANHLPQNMKKHKAELKSAYQRSLVKYKHALQASPIKLEKQIQHEIRHFTQHMHSMVARHWQICHTLTRANAEVTPDCSLTARDVQLIDDFIKDVLRLHDDVGDFCSTAMAKDAFLEQITAFETAASHDWFVVCTSPLKLNFHEPLDQPLFGAYCDDLQHRMKELHVSQLVSVAP